jgi:hypothetical protein
LYGQKEEIGKEKGSPQASLQKQQGGSTQEEQEETALPDV